MTKTNQLLIFWLHCWKIWHHVLSLSLHYLNCPGQNSVDTNPFISSHHPDGVLTPHAKWLLIPSLLGLQQIVRRYSYGKLLWHSPLCLWIYTINALPQCQSSSGSVGMSIWLAFRRPRVKSWLDLNVFLLTHLECLSSQHSMFPIIYDKIIITVCMNYSYSRCAWLSWWSWWNDPKITMNGIINVNDP